MLHRFGRAVGGAAAVTLLLVALAKPAHADTDAVCATINDKIAQLEQPINELRELLQGFANIVAGLQNSSAEVPPNITLGAYASDEEFKAKLAALRSQAAANEPELQRLRGLRVRFCSGQMASAPSAGSTAPSGGSFSRYQNLLPQTAYGAPSGAPSTRTPPIPRTNYARTPRSKIGASGTTKRTVKSSKPKLSKMVKATINKPRKVRTAQIRKGRSQKARMQRNSGRKHVARPGIIRDRPR